MDFWVTVATVLPILGLPLVLLARVHVAHMLDSPILARWLAGVYASLLIAIYAMEGLAFEQLADAADVTGSEALQDVAIFIIWAAVGALILSPGYLLFRIAFAGPGLGLKLAFVVPAYLVQIWWTDKVQRIDLARIRRQMVQVHRGVAHSGKAWIEAWDGYVARGLLVRGPASADAETRKVFDSMEKLRQSVLEGLAQSDVLTWRIHYASDRDQRRTRALRESVQKRLRRARADNLHAVWQVFDSLTAAQHERTGKALPEFPGHSRVSR